MTCPICGTWAPADPETGYNADDICPPCKALSILCETCDEIVSLEDVVWSPGSQYAFCCDECERAWEWQIVSGAAPDYEKGWDQ